MRSNQAIIDDNLKAAKAFNIPSAANWTLNGAKDVPGYIMYNTTLQAFGVYKGGGIWTTFAPSDLSSYLTTSSFLNPANVSQTSTYRFASDAEKATWNAKQSALGFTPENAANKGVAYGYAALDASSKLNLSNIPDALLGAVNYQGAYNASTNSPALPAAASGNKGYYWVVNTKAYSTRITPSDTLRVGDWVISNGSSLQKVDNNNAVTSVFGNVGAITAKASDYSAFYPLMTGSYANPSWITSLPFSKITGFSGYLPLTGGTVTGNVVTPAGYYLKSTFRFVTSGDGGGGTPWLGYTWDNGATTNNPCFLMGFASTSADEVWLSSFNYSGTQSIGLRYNRTTGYINIPYLTLPNTPTASTDAANKAYVDAAVSAASGGSFITSNTAQSGLTGNKASTANWTFANSYNTSSTPTIGSISTTILGTGATVTIAGTNQCGLITVNTGTISGSTGGTMFTVTMSNSFQYPNSCVPVFQWYYSSTGSYPTIVPQSVGVLSFSVLSPTVGALASNSTYKFYYNNPGY